jgi:uncharacterized NAD(P)/FAD-binding protein YdhS
MTNARPRSVGIVGAGFTGTMLAVHLIELSRVPLRVILFDRTATFGNGTAYATPNAKHLLNVRVGNMSAYDADPDHFVRWLGEQKEACAGPQSRRAFVSRGTYGAICAPLLKQRVSRPVRARPWSKSAPK